MHAWRGSVVATTGVRPINVAKDEVEGAKHEGHGRNVDDEAFIGQIAAPLAEASRLSSTPELFFVVTLRLQARPRCLSDRVLLIVKEILHGNGRTAVPEGCARGWYGEGGAAGRQGHKDECAETRHVSVRRWRSS